VEAPDDQRIESPDADSSREYRDDADQEDDCQRRACSKGKPPNAPTPGLALYERRSNEFVDLLEGPSAWGRTAPARRRVDYCGDAHDNVPPNSGLGLRTSAR